MTRRGAFELPLLVAVLGAALPLSGSSYLLGIGFSLCCWIALVQSWTVLSAMAGYVSLGHVVFYGLGAYVVALSWGVLPLPVALVLAGAVAGAFALLVGLPVLRVRGPYFVILTFGIAELVKYVVILIESRLGEFSRLMFGAPDLPWLYAIALGLAVAATLGAVLIRGSRLGRGLLALRENEEAAETVGVPTTRLKLIAFVLSSIIPGIVGGLVALRTAYFEPMQAFDPTVSFTIVTMAVVGGSDDARGPLLGAAFFTLLSELLWARLPQFYMVVLGLLLIFFVLFIPRGIAGIVLSRLRRSPT
jgi:branched-chain amino acid transport system permease protein